MAELMSRDQFTSYHDMLRDHGRRRLDIACVGEPGYLHIYDLVSHMASRLDGNMREARQVAIMVDFFI